MVIMLPRLIRHGRLLELRHPAISATIHESKSMGRERRMRGFLYANHLGCWRLKGGDQLGQYAC